MKTNYEKLMKINYEKLLIFYLPFTPGRPRTPKAVLVPRIFLSGAAAPL